MCEYDPPGNVAGEYKLQVSKAGEAKDGELGIGAAGSMAKDGEWRGLLMVLGAAYAVLAVCA